MAAKIYKTAKVGEKINCISVALDSLMKTQESKLEVMNVIGVSNYFICLDGDMFPKLTASKTFDFGYHELEKVSISESSSEVDIKYFGKFKITLHTKETSKKKIESLINREFKKWLNKKIGAYGAAMEVDIKLDLAA